MLFFIKISGGVQSESKSEAELFMSKAPCSVKTKEDLRVLEPYLYRDRKTNVRKFYSSVEAKSNRVFPDFIPDEDVLLTKGNGFCNRGVYDSWQACNSVGQYRVRNRKLYRELYR